MGGILLALKNPAVLAAVSGLAAVLGVEEDGSSAIASHATTAVGAVAGIAAIVFGVKQAKQKRNGQSSNAP